LFNFLSLLSLVFFIFSVLGVQLFATVEVRHPSPCYPSHVTPPKLPP
jgi:hypothetical protein